MMQMAMTFIDRNEITGDYFEFGVYRAKTFRSAYRWAQHKKLGMHFYAFDSFAGLPELKDEDHGGRFQPGEYEMSRADFEALLAEEGIPKTAFTVVEGFYEDSLKPELKLHSEKAALIHLDCDLYSSTKVALDWCAPYLQEGTILLFDDFYHYKGSPNQGQQRALTEFLQENPAFGVSAYQRYTWQSKAFIVYLKS